MKKNRRIIMIILLVLVVVAVGAWYLVRPTLAARNEITASGTIESSQVRISPEVSGVVKAINVKEGANVKAGEVLAKIDDAIAQTQYQQAQAALKSAQENLALSKSNYDLVAANTAPEQRKAAIEAAKLDVINAQQALQALYDNAGVNKAQAQDSVASLDKARDKAQTSMDNVVAPAKQVDINAAWASVVIAQDKLEKAQEKFEPYANKDQSNVTRAQLLAVLSAAQKQYDSMLQRYNNLVGTPNQYNVAVAKANVGLADARLADANRQSDQLVDGIDPKALETAQAALATAQAKLAALQADPSAKQLAVAQDQIDVAQAQVESVTAQLKTIETQLEKYTIKSPTDGVVLSKGVEVGETTGPGADMFEIGPLQNLQLTVYLPEEQFGRVKPGDQASVKVDAYPNRTFTAHVDRLANQAEFTPRNVQTAEGRRQTVFAIYLSLDNADLALMPGMWADVTFNIK
jgi:HlyD family secretion protein